MLFLERLAALVDTAGQKIGTRTHPKIERTLREIAAGKHDQTLEQGGRLCVADEMGPTARIHLIDLKTARGGQVVETSYILSMDENGKPTLKKEGTFTIPINHVL